MEARCHVARAPSGSSPARRSIHPTADATLAPCGARSITPSPTRQAIAHHTRKALEKALGMSGAEIGPRTVYEVTHNSAANHFHQIAIFLPLTSFPSNAILAFN